MSDRFPDDYFSIGDRIVHLAEPWYRDYTHRTGTVLDVNPCGNSRYGNHGDMHTKRATKLRVRWDRLPCGRVNQTAVSWVLADWCRLLPCPMPDGSIVFRDGEPVSLYDLPESHAIVEAVASLASIPTQLLIAIEPFRAPEPPPVVDALRADEI